MLHLYGSICLPNRRTISRLLAGAMLLIGLGSTIQAQEEVSFRGKLFVQEQGVWYQEEHGMRFQVEKDVISVRFRSTVEDGARLPFVADQGSAILRQNRLGIMDLIVPEGETALDFARRLQATGQFDFAEVNTVGTYTGPPNDPLYGNQWAKNNTGQTGGSNDADIDAPEAWDITAGAPQVIVAVLDSGTDIDHVDLECNIWVNPGEDLDNDGVVWDTDDINGQDDDNNGRVDDIAGWDFHNGNNDPRGPFFHGTHVAGIVAACSDNGTGIAGVAGGIGGGVGVKMMAVGVGDSAPNSSIMDDAILYAADNGAHVITLSLSAGSSSATDAAIEAAYAQGVFINNASGNGGGAIGYPANHPDIVAVGSTNDQDVRASSSAFGPQLELVAPGVNILSTQIGNSYGTSSGTSFASPHVAGVAGLMFSLNPGATNEDVRACLHMSADDQVGPGGQDTFGYDNFFGHGRLNARAALECIGSSAPGEATGLTMRKGAIGGRWILNWDPTCAESIQDYAIYSGQIGNWYSHTQVRCTDEFGDLTEAVGQLIGSRYFLVVPVDTINEGSYGLSSDGAERPAGGGVQGACRAGQNFQGCKK